MQLVCKRIILFFAGLLLAVHPALAAEFNANLIIDDAEMRRADAMSYEDVRNFLAMRGGLGGVRDVDAIDGQVKEAAQLINDAAKRYQVNPRYLLALIQKESSAVETAAPTANQLEWATGYALCDGCYKTAELPEKYRGFAKQVDAGAGWIDWYWKSALQDRSLRQPGQTYEISGMLVTPANMATAALYSYTPHLQGNQLLWNIIDRWFGSSSQLMRFPDGTLVRNPANGAVALIQGSRFRPILKASVLSTRFNATRIVNVSVAEFEAMDRTMRGRPVRFSDLSLVRDENGSTYLLVGDRKRRIVSPQVFAKIGFNPEEVEDVAAEDLADYRDDQPIAEAVAFPVGALLQDPKSGGVYYVENGVKRPIWDRSIMVANFGSKPITPAMRGQLDSLPTGNPMLFDDGVLVKTPTDPTVYVVSGAKLRAIPSESSFLSFGYSFKNVLTASPKALALHQIGLPLAEL